MNTTDKLNQLAEFRAQNDLLLLDYNAKRAAILATIADELEALDAEYNPQFEAVTANTTALEAAIKSEVLSLGASVKGSHLQAVYTKGRTSWDTKGLDGYAVAHPEIQTFRKEGAPSVSIR